MTLKLSLGKYLLNIVLLSEGFPNVHLTFLALIGLVIDNYR